MISSILLQLSGVCSYADFPHQVQYALTFVQLLPCLMGSVNILTKTVWMLPREEAGLILHSRLVVTAPITCEIRKWSCKRQLPHAHSSPSTDLDGPAQDISSLSWEANKARECSCKIRTAHMIIILCWFTGNIVVTWQTISATVLGLALHHIPAHGVPDIYNFNVVTLYELCCWK